MAACYFFSLPFKPGYEESLSVFNGSTLFRSRYEPLHSFRVLSQDNASMVALPASDCICQRCVRDIICSVVAPGCYEAHWSVVIDLVVDCRISGQYSDGIKLQAHK